MSMDQRALRKIKRCLALAKSSNANEAATALRQAQALMNKHRVSQADVAAADICSHLVPAGSGMKPPTYIVDLVNLMRRAFGVEVVYHAEHIGGRWAGRVEFIGRDGAPEVAGYALTVLGRHLKRDRSAYMKTLRGLRRGTKMRRADLYARAWVEAVESKVVAEPISETDKAALNAYKTRAHGELKEGEPRDRGFQANDVGAVRRGLKDGDRVQFHQGMGRDGQDLLALGGRG